MGNIPEHWNVKKLKHIFQEKKKVTNPILNCGSISFGKVVYKDDDKIPASTKASYQEVLAGEFLINPLNLNYDLISLRIGLSDINVVVSSGYIVLKNVIKLDKSYFNYLLHRYDVAYMKLLGSGVRQTINFNHIANSLLAFPPLQEQTTIANFLDNKTSKIDTAIAQKEQMIALLKERKQIIIQNAVTGKWSMVNGQWSMTPREKMKDSGVEWIGEIPEGWEVMNLRYAFEFLNYKRIPLSAIERETMQGKYPYYGASGIIDYVNDYIFDEETILIAEDGANLLSKSTPLAFVATGQYWVNNHAHILKPKFDGFLYWAELLSLVDYTVYITGAAQPKLSRENLGSVKVVVPSETDLLKISEYIKTVNVRFEEPITLQQSQIEKLKEYKATLIDGAVTGKIMVNG